MKLDCCLSLELEVYSIDLLFAFFDFLPDQYRH